MTALGQKLPADYVSQGGILGSKSDDFAVNQKDLKLVTAHNVKHLEASRDEDEWFA